MPPLLLVRVKEPVNYCPIETGRYYCAGVEMVEVRSVPTADNPDCPVNYCVPAHDRMLVSKLSVLTENEQRELLRLLRKLDHSLSHLE